MKIVVLGGSPKGKTSVTMQYVHYIRKVLPAHEFEILQISSRIKKLEKDEQAFSEVIEQVRSADLVLWAFPLYVFLVPSQYKRKLPRQQDISKVEFSASFLSLKTAGGSPPSASWGRSSL